MKKIDFDIKSCFNIKYIPVYRVVLGNHYFPPGVLGFTRLDGKFVRRSDLYGRDAIITDLHEVAHNEQFDRCGYTDESTTESRAVYLYTTGKKSCSYIV